jgi:hypothetical protein
MTAVKATKQVVRQAGIVRVEDVVAAPYNPPGRTAEKALKQLLASMEDIGLLYPVLIDDGKNLIDGHRRLACAKLLGWEEIAAITLPRHDVHPDKAYASVNVTARKMGGNDALAVWLKNPQAVHRKQAALFEQMRDDVGIALVRKACAGGFSPRLYRTARELARHIGQDGPGFIRKAFVWLMDHATVGQVTKAMEAGESPQVFLDAISRGKGITLRLAVSEKD